MEFHANLIDIPARSMVASIITIESGKIAGLRAIDAASQDVTFDSLPYLLPGFIDAHIHIESSMLVPSEFARIAVRHGTIATVSDPHEIANVMGMAGVDFMIADADRVPLHFFFGAPSCVPATPFETSGARLDADHVEQLLARDEILYLAEMMNYPGVLAADPQVLAKIAAAQRHGKPIDGHAPGLRGEQAIAYFRCGISTDHECTTCDEALHKIAHGAKILIREGSAAKDFEALYRLIDLYPQSVMLCSDDKHPDELAVSHINALVARAIAAGCDLYHTLAAACLNPIDHYRLPLGRLRVGDPADFILVRDLQSWQVDATYLAGECVFQDGETKIDRIETTAINQFRCNVKSAADFTTAAKDGDDGRVRVIQAIDGSLVTESFDAKLQVQSGQLHADPPADILKLTVVNRYADAPPATAFIRGFGLSGGAIASSVAHDSHNIVAVGVSDSLLADAVNLVIQHQGGIVAISESEQHVLPLPVAGIMSLDDCETVSTAYHQLDRFAKQQLRSSLTAPFMTLSFMALLVIPSLKLSDRGLFDGDTFCFANHPR